MLPEYSDILHKRKDLIRKSLEWSNEFLLTLSRSKLVNEAFLAQIEGDKRDERKTVLLLVELKQCPIPGAFNKFCDILEECGQKKLLKTLHEDRYQIVWDFQIEGPYSSPSDFITIIQEQLFRRYESESDAYLRNLVWQEMCARVSKLKDKLCSQRKERETLRQELIAVCPDSEAIKSKLPGHATSKLLCNDIDIQSDIIVLEETRKSIIELTKTLQRRTEELDLLQDTRKKEVFESLLKSSDLTSQKSKVEMLSNMIKDQDKKILRLKDDISAAERQNVFIRRTDISALLDQVQSRLPKHKRKTDVHDSGVVKAMRCHIGNLLQTLEKSEDSAVSFKKRLGQLSERVTELELERETLKNVLQSKSGSGDPLQDLLQQKIKEYEEEKLDMEGEISSLRNRIGLLAAEDRSLSEKLEDAERSDANGESPARKSSTGSNSGSKKLLVLPNQAHRKGSAGGTSAAPRRRASLVGVLPPGSPKGAKEGNGKRRASIISPP